VLVTLGVVACAGPGLVLPGGDEAGMSAAPGPGVLDAAAASGSGPAAAAAPGPGAVDAAAASIGAVGAISAGSASRDSGGPPDPQARRSRIDPLESLNRGVARFNDVLDDYFLRPVARVYDDYTPEAIRMITRNFLSNLLDPYIAVNNLLQGKPRAAFSDLGRFTFNTTFGFFGFGDPATDIGLEKHREDFGQTLGVWGVPTGPYLVLPLFGPSNLRDGFGFAVDAYGALINRFDNVPFRNSVAGLELIDVRARLLPTQRVLEEALDRYLLVRDSYLQRRRNLVYDGDPPDKDEE
jgi:phospholipid-binding lipoprotein MlaA